MSKIIVVGAGLVGPVVAMHLAELGHKVEVWEKRGDPLRVRRSRASSANLTLCARGLASLADIGLEPTIRDMCVPAYGRLIHNPGGLRTFQPYGSRGEAIYSILRADLNRLLIEHAKRVYGIPFRFGHTCIDVDPGQPAILFQSSGSGERIHRSADIIVAADGVYSTVRAHLCRLGKVECSAQEMEQGYKEIDIAAGVNDWRADREVLHLWPRQTHMFIVFPNIAGDFTGALHLPFHGECSLDSIQRPSDVLRLFEESFSDVLPLVPNLADDFVSRPTSKMTTIRCSPWHFEGKVILLGDAAHAIYPLYGQGANAGFEDCRLLVETLRNCGGRWSEACERFWTARKRDMDVIAELCVSNSIELRDHVADRSFQLRKAVERRVNELLPARYMPLYSMISFTLMPYADALQVSREQNAMIDRLLCTENLEDKLASGDFGRLVLEAAGTFRRAELYDSHRPGNYDVTRTIQRTEPAA
jgi:kynurenine 3-monooxygenase